MDNALRDSVGRISFHQKSCSADRSYQPFFLGRIGAVDLEKAHRGHVQATNQTSLHLESCGAKERRALEPIRIRPDETLCCADGRDEMLLHMTMWLHSIS